jgi:hypothetical protein
MQDRCTVWDERTRGSKIVLYAPDGTTRRHGMWNLVSVRSETVLVLGQDSCTVCAERTLGSEVVLDAPNGTPR